MANNILDLDGENDYQLHQEMLREAPDHYTFLDGLETVIEQNFFAFGAYRPHRFLPCLYMSKQDQEGRVIHHGQIVSGVNMITGIGDGKYDLTSGLNDSGWFSTQEGFLQTLKANVDGPYGLDRTLDGMIMPCNGSTADVNDLVTAHDVQIKRMLANGKIASTADVNTPAMSRLANQIPLGVVGQIAREMDGSNLTYRMYSAAYSVIRYGVLKIPYAHEMTADERAAVRNKHQFLDIPNGQALSVGKTLSVDGYGHFTINPAFRKFGRVESWTNRTFTPLRSRVDTFPDNGMHLPGTMTGGLDRRMFEFVKACREATTPGNASIAEVAAAVETGRFGYVKVLFNTTMPAPA